MKNHHPVELFSIFQLFLFCFLLLCIHYHLSHQQSGCFEQKGPDKPTVHYLLSAKWQTHKVGSYLIDIVEHLAAEETLILIRRWWERKTEIKGEWILNLFDGRTKHNYEWILMMLFNSWRSDLLTGQCCVYCFFRVPSNGPVNQFYLYVIYVFYLRYDV